MTDQEIEACKKLRPLTLAEKAERMLRAMVETGTSYEAIFGTDVSYSMAYLRVRAQKK